MYKWLCIQHRQMSKINVKTMLDLCYGCIIYFVASLCTHLSTTVAWREKKCKHFVFYIFKCNSNGVQINMVQRKMYKILQSGPIRKHPFPTYDLRNSKSILCCVSDAIHFDLDQAWLGAVQWWRVGDGLHIILKPT